MRYTAEKVQALKDEIQAWLLSKDDDLDHDTHWETADEYYGEEHLTYPTPHYLVLCCGSQLANVFSYGCSNDPERFRKLFDEFEEIILRHGFWFENEDGVTISILGEEED